jgi:TonB family protein
MNCLNVPLSVVALALAASLSSCASPTDANRGVANARTGTIAVDTGSRSFEEVRNTLEANKAAVYTAYNRALRSDPKLTGSVVIELRVSAAGTVTQCLLVSSSLGSKSFETELLEIVRQFKFGAREVSPTVITWPFQFLPS